MTKALILCAGEGNRILPLTKNIPKPMIPVGGHPLLEYNIQLCKKNGIKEIFINTSYLPKKIKEYFGDGSKFGVKITYSYESSLLGTAGALNNFREYFKQEPFVVIYGDNLTNINLKKMVLFHKEKNAFATLFLYQEKMSDEKTTPGVVIVNSDFEIRQIIENPSKEEKEKISKVQKSLRYGNTGIYVLDPQVFDFIPMGPSDFSKDIFPEALNKGHKLQGFASPCFFRELGSKKRYRITNKQISSGQIKLGLINDDS